MGNDFHQGAAQGLPEQPVRGNTSWVRVWQQQADPPRTYTTSGSGEASLLDGLERTKHNQGSRPQLHPGLLWVWSRDHQAEDCYDGGRDATALNDLHVQTTSFKACRETSSRLTFPFVGRRLAHRCMPAANK